MPSRAPRITRRKFLARTGGALAALAVVPRHVLGRGETPPSDRIAIAAIGISGRGEENWKSVAKERIVALCDVDDRRAAKAFAAFPDARRFRDFRKLLDEMEKSIDAVVVSTPDHTHAVAAMAAIRRGKHVYCEKPLAHSVFEVRELVRAAREKKVVTQLGNQGHSFDSIRDFVEWVRAGAIGEVKTVHAACGSTYSTIRQLDRLAEKHEVPKELDWDLWLGPAAARPYHPAYLPGKWRSWFPFGTGVIGDWVCHVVDPVFWALDLGAPSSVVAQVDGFDPVRHADTFPRGSEIRFEFPAKAGRGPVTLIWYDGSRKIPRPAELEPKKDVPGTGAVVAGDKGTIIYGSHGAGGVHLIPDEKMAAFGRPAKTLPRGLEHHRDWLDAIRKGGRAGSDFEYGGALAEIALVGVIATRFPGRKLAWDAAAMRFPDCDEANRYLKPHFREGWSL